MKFFENMEIILSTNIMISVASKLQFLLDYKFPPKTTDEEKIIFVYTHGYTVSQIAQVFHFGHHKLCRVINH